MSEFQRARSQEQKDERINEIKKAAAKQFQEKSYSDISMTSIASDLGWTRANLYKYIKTKEEIYLLLAEEKREEYINSLLSAIPEKSGYSNETLSEVWAEILKAHPLYIRYSDILITIIETNVSVDKLALFKKNYYESAARVTSRLKSLLKITEEDAYSLFIAVHYHAIGIGGICTYNPLIQEALEKAGIHPAETDFKESMKEFILMNLEYYTRKQDLTH